MGNANGDGQKWVGDCIVSLLSLQPAFPHPLSHSTGDEFSCSEELESSLLHLLFRLQEADGWAADLHFMIGGMAPFYHKLIKRA